MKFDYNNQDSAETMNSPLTGKPVEFSVRAFCSKCGCLISHKSVEAVKVALEKWDRCKKCGCIEATVRFTLEEEILGNAVKDQLQTS